MPTNKVSDAVKTIIVQDETNKVSTRPESAKPDSPDSFAMAPEAAAIAPAPTQTRAPMTFQDIVAVLRKFEGAPGAIAIMGPYIEASEGISLDFLRNYGLPVFEALTPKNKWIHLAHSLSRLNGPHVIEAYQNGQSGRAFKDIHNPQFQEDMRTLVENLGQALRQELSEVTDCLKKMIYVDGSETKQYLDKVDWTQPEHIKWLINFYLDNPQVQVTKDILSELIINKNTGAVEALRDSLRKSPYRDLGKFLPMLPALYTGTDNAVSEDLKEIVLAKIKSHRGRDGQLDHVSELHAILMVLFNHDLPNFLELLEKPNILSEAIIALTSLPEQDQPAAVMTLLNHLPTPIVGGLSDNGPLHILGNIAENSTDLFNRIVSMADGSYSYSPEVKMLGIKLLESMVQNFDDELNFKPAEEALVRLALEFEGNIKNNPYVSVVDQRPEIINLWLTYARDNLTSLKYPRYTLLYSENVPDADKLAIIKAHPQMIGDNHMQVIVDLLKKTSDSELRNLLVTYCRKNGFYQNEDILIAFFADTFNPEEAPIRKLFLKELENSAYLKYLRGKHINLIINALEKYKEHPAIQTVWKLHELRTAPENQIGEIATQLVDSQETPTPALLVGLLEFFSKTGFSNMPSNVIAALRTHPVPRKLIGEPAKNLISLAAEHHRDPEIRSLMLTIEAEHPTSDEVVPSAGGGGIEAEITAINDFDEFDVFGGVPAGYGFVGNGFFAPNFLGGVKL